MSIPRTVLSEVVPEASTSLFSGSLVDEAGEALGAAQLASFRMTLYTLTTGFPIVNALDSVDVLNAGRGTVSAGGAWTITLEPADNAILAANAHLSVELRRLLLEWTYGPAGAKAGRHEIEYQVANLQHVP